ncbi:CRISPR-associated protein Cas2 [Kitasatospora acidiphila]
MASMITLSVSAVPDHLRGALTRWLLEVTPYLYVGTVSARVRDELWAAASNCIADGVAVLVYPAANEQGFEIRTAGEQRRYPVDFDGLTLLSFRTASAEGGHGAALGSVPSMELLSEVCPARMSRSLGVSDSVTVNSWYAQLIGVLER